MVFRFLVIKKNSYENILAILLSNWLSSYKHDVNLERDLHRCFYSLVYDQLALGIQCFKSSNLNNQTKNNLRIRCRLWRNNWIADNFLFLKLKKIVIL